MKATQTPTLTPMRKKSKLSGIAAGAQVNTVTSVAGKTGAVSLVAGAVVKNAITPEQYEEIVGESYE